MCKLINSLVQVSFEPAVAIQRALQQLPVKCPYNCSIQNLTKGNLKAHASQSCSKRLINCPVPFCTHSSLAETFPQHFASVHGDFLTANINKLFQQPPSPSSNNTRNITDADNNNNNTNIASDNRIESLSNRNGHATRLGKTGLHY